MWLWDDHKTHGDSQCHCPYVSPEASEVHLAKRLQHFLSDATLRGTKADWYCTQCATDYHGERYYLNCRTGGFSHPTTMAA
ncbi:putative zinc ribbon protein [Edwardsiella tarda]|uniref:putative zinc ribbon protein n=1 Tax=Edwardsiella tarda TaxID=636 RepID=UPI003F65C3C6